MLPCNWFGSFVTRKIYYYLNLVTKISELVGKNGRYRLLLSNLSWQSLEQGTRMVAGIFTGILLASYLGPDFLGMYSYASSFVLLFSPLLSLGYDGFLVRDIIFEKDNWAEILGSAIVMKTAGAILGILLVFGFVWFDTAMDPEVRRLSMVLSFSFLFYPFDVFDIWFRARLRSKIASVSKIIAIVTINGLKLFLIYYKAPLMSFAWLYVAEFFVNGLMQLFFYTRIEPDSLKRLKATKRRYVFVLQESWPLLVSSFSLLLYNRIDQIMIGNMLDNRSVGLFAAAGKISELPIAIIMVVNASFYPFLALTYKDKPALFHRQYAFLTAIYTALSYLMLIVVFFGSGLIMSIYPKSFSEGASVLVINFIGLVFVFNAGLRNSWLSLTGNQKFLLYTTVFSAVFNILLNFVLIPYYGINGAAWASTITEFLALFLLNAAYPKIHYLLKEQGKGLVLGGLWKKGL